MIDAKHIKCRPLTVAQFENGLQQFERLNIESDGALDSLINVAKENRGVLESYKSIKALFDLIIKNLHLPPSCKRETIRRKRQISVDCAALSNSIEELNTQLESIHDKGLKILQSIAAIEADDPDNPLRIDSETTLATLKLKDEALAINWRAYDEYKEEHFSLVQQKDKLADQYAELFCGPLGKL